MGYKVREQDGDRGRVRMRAPSAQNVPAFERVAIGQW